MIEVVANEYPVKNEFGKGYSDELYTDITSKINSVKTIFQEKAKLRDRNYRFYKGDQWTEAEKVAHRRQFRIPYVFNEIQHKIGHVSGSQIQTRLEGKIYPREKSDSQQAELLNYILKWAEQTNELEDIEKNVFVEGLVGAASATIVRWDRYGLTEGMPVVERFPTEEAMWDTASIRQDLKDAQWICRVIPTKRKLAAEMFPSHQDIIGGTATVDGTNVSLTRMSTTRSKRLKPFILDNDKGDEIIEVIEFYERRKIYQYVVGDEISDDIKAFDDKPDAESYYQGLIDEYDKNGEDLYNPDGSPRILLTTTMKDGIWQTYIVGKDVIENNLTDLPDFPIVINFGYFHDGDYWAFVDNLIGPQMLVNRSFSQWDYQLGASSKNMTTVIPALLQKGFGIEDFRREHNKTSTVIPVMRHDAIQEHPNSQPPPALFDNISFGIQRMNDYAGGRNALGLQENAAESGRAVIARAEQGGLARLPLFDNLKIWRRGITERLVWWIKNYMSPDQIIRIIGMNDDIQYMNLDDGVLDTLQEIEVDVHIAEASQSETVNERYFEQLKELFATMPGVPPDVVIKTMMPFSTIPEKQKKEIIDYIGGYQEYMKQQEVSKHEQKLKEQVQDQVTKRDIKDVLTRADTLDEMKKDIEKKQRGVESQIGKLMKLKEDYAAGGGEELQDNKKAVQSSLNNLEQTNNGTS